MDLKQVLVVLLHVYAALAFDCPSSCVCRKAEVGGYVAQCSRLNENQRFSNYIQHLTITDLDPRSKFVLDKDIFTKVNLEELNTLTIVNTTLSAINPSIFNGLDKLRNVDLSNNAISFIHPDTFKNNTNLELLSLSGNPLQHLIGSASNTKQDYFLYSPSLSEIDLSNCNIQHLRPDLFNELPSLINLNLASNNIKDIKPKLFEKIEYVEEIDLSGNELTHIKPNLFDFVSDVSVLNLSNNSLESFDNIEVIGLEELDLSFNKFRTVQAETLDGVQDLRALNFSHNEIIIISEDTFDSVTKLRHLDLSYNQLQGPLSQNMFVSIPELETLSLSNNVELRVFGPFVGYFGSLYTLDLSLCGIRMLTVDSFNKMESISTLNLSGNELTDIAEKTFNSIPSVTSIDLSDNNLQILHENLFSANRDLEKLYLSGNKLHHMPARMFKPIPNLDVLDVHKNRLTYLWNMDETKYMKDNKILSELTYLNLEENRFKTLHKHNFESLVSLKALDISKNQLQCDQHINYLMQWLITSKVTPIRYLGKSSVDMQKEHAELHWGDMLSKICFRREDLIPSQSLDQPTGADGLDAFDADDDFKFSTAFPKFTQDFPLNKTHAIYVESRVFGNENIIYSWPILPILVCGLCVLLVIINVTALLLYRSGRSYRSVSLSPRFDSPFKSQMRVRHNTGSLYHKLYEECSVPKDKPIVKNNVDLPKIFEKKLTLITTNSSKGEDMV
ncbi:leucine-rich repeat-containing protein 15 [Nilaparvata lugens]|uniref:leucine-rich repeat-containing protein 15 n=1 Tax=Nilaparvata lugens TaxID=108931 RepID=UPI00193D76C0|nr:leucine-rich repeat-containing protein 15 [Nilaparvata lugens]